MESLHYIVRHPSAERSAGSQPLLVLLHGYGSNEEDLLGLAPYLDARFLIASARAPQVLDFGGFAWFPIDFKPDGLVLRFDQAGAAREKIRDLVETLRTEHPVERVFLLGFSQGASMAISTALAHPGLCDGVAFLSGVCAPELVPDGVRPAVPALPVLMTHGRQDLVLPIQQGRAARELLSRLSVDLDYKEYDMGHEINPECLQDLSDWLARHLDLAER